MPIDRNKYPADWEMISWAVRQRAGNKCELCYAPNGELVYRDKNSGTPWNLYENLDQSEMEKFKPVRVVLTVHHIDFNKMNNSKHNLIALCQRCHLRLDMERHVNNRRNRKGKFQEKIEI